MRQPKRKKVSGKSRIPMLGVRVPKEIADRLRAKAREQGVTATAIVIQAIKTAIEDGPCTGTRSCG